MRSRFGGLLLARAVYSLAGDGEEMWVPWCGLVNRFLCDGWGCRGFRGLGGSFLFGTKGMGLG